MSTVTVVPGEIRLSHDPVTVVLETDDVLIAEVDCATKYQDCATENQHGALLRLGQIGGGAYAQVRLLNGRILAAPARLDAGHSYNAGWRNDPENGHFIFNWRFPKWEAVG